MKEITSKSQSYIIIDAMTNKTLVMQVHGNDIDKNVFDICFIAGQQITFF